MSPGEIFAVGVLLFGVTGMLVHRTAAVLVAAWLFNMLAHLAEGTPLPIPAYVLSDAVAFVLIMSWRTTLTDYIVLGIYPVMWVVYAAGISGSMTPLQQYWWLYALAGAQFVAAGPWPAIARNRSMEGRRIKPKWRKLFVANQSYGCDHDQRH